MARLMKKFVTSFILLVALMAPDAVHASVSEVIAKALCDHLGAERAEVIEVLSIRPARPIDQATSASIIALRASGEAQLLVRGARGAERNEVSAEYRVRYAAWVTGWTPVRRVSPGEALAGDVLQQRQINIAEGLAHEYRGAILTAATDPSGLEARQTLLAGDFISTGAVKTVPDIRRGDAVPLVIVSGGVRLLAPATALEPSRFDQKIRVQSLKGKREFLGVLRSGPRVEVTL